MWDLTLFLFYTGMCIKLMVPVTPYTFKSFPFHWTFVKLVQFRSYYIILAFHTLLCCTSFSYAYSPSWSVQAKLQFYAVS
jgi:hypothetical protein